VSELNLSKEELQFLLNRAWEIEKYFESLTSWKGYITVDSSYRKMLLSLLLDSEKHRVQLEQLLINLNFPIPTTASDIHFHFQDKYDAEVLTEIAKQEEIARDLYTSIVENTDSTLIEELTRSNDTSMFYRTLDQLVKDEKRHIHLLRKNTSTITRIK
jgi:rubrerythrin